MTPAQIQNLIDQFLNCKDDHCRDNIINALKNHCTDDQCADISIKILRNIQNDLINSMGGCAEPLCTDIGSEVDAIGGIITDILAHQIKKLDLAKLAQNLKNLKIKNSTIKLIPEYFGEAIQIITQIIDLLN